MGLCKCSNARSYLHCVLPSPLPRTFLISAFVGLAEMGNIRHERVVRVGVGEERTDGKQDFADSERRAPLVL